MAKFMMLLYDTPEDFAGMSPEEMQKVIAKYAAWRDGLEKAGRLLGGDKLTDGEGRVMRSDNGTMRVLDGPYGETKEVIGGYFAVTAANYDDVVKLSGDCPHLEFGGTIEIREIEEH